MTLNSDAEIDSARERMLADSEDWYQKWLELSKKFKDQGMPISHVLLQLTVEDLITTLIQMWREGKFNPDELDFPPSMAMEVADNLEYSLEWTEAMRWSILEYLSGLREEKNNAGTNREGTQ